MDCLTQGNHNYIDGWNAAGFLRSLDCLNQIPCKLAPNAWQLIRVTVGRWVGCNAARQEGTRRRSQWANRLTGTGVAFTRDSEHLIFGDPKLTQVRSAGQDEVVHLLILAVCPYPKYTRVGQWARRGELVHLEVIPLGDEGRHCGSRKASAMLRVEGRSGRRA